MIGIWAAKVKQWLKIGATLQILRRMFTGIYRSVARRLLTNIALAIAAAISGVSDLPVSEAMVIVREGTEADFVQHLLSAHHSTDSPSRKYGFTG